MHGIGQSPLREGQTSSLSLNINIIFGNEFLRVDNPTQLFDPNFLFNLQKKEESFQISKQERDSKNYVDLSSRQEISPKKRDLGSGDFFGFTAQKETALDAVKNLKKVPSKGPRPTKKSSDPKNVPNDSSLLEGNHHFSKPTGCFRQKTSKSLKKQNTKRVQRQKLKRKLRKISSLISRAWREKKSLRTPSIMKKVKFRREFSDFEVTRFFYGKCQLGKKLKRS